MSISTYSELKTAVALWLHRSDTSGIIPDLIRMGESRINRELRILDMITTQTGTLDTSVRTLALPDRFAERVTFRLNSPVKNLIWVSPDKIDQYFGDSTSATGSPSYYSVADSIEFDRVPDAAYSYTLKYYKGYQLSADADTNYLLTNYPQLYLYAALVHSGVYTRDLNFAAGIEPLLRQEITSMKKAEAKRKGTGAALLTTELSRSGRYNIDTGE